MTKKQPSKLTLPNAMSRRQALGVLGMGGLGLGLALAGCGDDADTAAGPETAVDDFTGTKQSVILRQSFIAQQNTLREGQAKLWAQENGAEIDFTLGGNWRELIAAIVADGTGGDIGELFNNQAFIYENSLVDVSDLVEELGDQYGGWYDLAAESAQVDGVWRAVPWAYTAQAINYREDILTEAGVVAPTTYDELLEVATKLDEQGLPPAGLSMSQTGPNDSANMAYSLLWSFGGAEVEEDGKTVAINSDGTRAALEYFQKLAAVSTPNITAYDEGGNNRAFLAGEISMTQNATSIYLTAETDAPEVFAGMNHFSYPEGPAGRQEFIQMNLLGIFDFAQNQEASKDLIRFMLQPENMDPVVQVGLSFYTPMFPSYEEKANMPWNIDPKLGALRGTANGGHLPGWPGPASRASATAYEQQSVVNMFAAVATGDGIDSAISRAEAELKTAYGS
ncbi:MAG: extracellular solute-binding protein [Actinomycetota bacterium]